MFLFGRTDRLGVEVGPYLDDGGQLREVDVWCGGRRLTWDDNHAFVPQFRPAVEATLGQLAGGQDLTPPSEDVRPTEWHRAVSDDVWRLRQRYLFLNWGPTTDDFTAFVFRGYGGFVVTYTFWRSGDPDEVGRVYWAEVPEGELVATLREAAEFLRTDGPPAGPAVAG